MNQDVSVYDLGEIRTGPVRPSARPRPRPAARASLSALPAGAATLSYVVPGAGHLLIREPVAALFFASTFGFAASLSWALASQLPRAAATLEVLGAAPQWSAAALVASAVAGAALHVAAVVQALRHASEIAEPGAPPGAVSLLASAFVPGWGQVLAGRAAAAGIFLSLAWALAGVWVAAAPPGQDLLRAAGVALPRAMLDGGGPTALVAATVLVWAVGLYDAAAGAARRRG